MPQHLTVLIFKMPDTICMIFGTLQCHFIGVWIFPGHVVWILFSSKSQPYFAKYDQLS